MIYNKQTQPKAVMELANRVATAPHDELSLADILLLKNHLNADMHLGHIDIKYKSTMYIIRDLVKAAKGERLMYSPVEYAEGVGVKLDRNSLQEELGALAKDHPLDTRIINDILQKPSQVIAKVCPDTEEGYRQMLEWVKAITFSETRCHVHVADTGPSN